MTPKFVVFLWLINLICTDHTGFTSDGKIFDTQRKRNKVYHEAFCDKSRLQGSGITVGVLDSSINVNHEVFKDSPLNGKNFVKDKRGDYWKTNCHCSHGTMVAGIVASIAKSASIYLCCISDKGNYYPKDNVKLALQHLYNMDKHVDVVIMSFGQEKDTNSYYREEIDQLHSKGVVLISAAGNGGVYQRQVAHPARLDNVIAVGSICGYGDQCGEPSKFNPAETSWIDVYAPGETVHCPVHDDNESWKECGGTSCSAPAVGAVVAKLLEFSTINDPSLKQKIQDIRMLKKLFSSKESPFMCPKWDNCEEYVLHPKAAFQNEPAILLRKLNEFFELYSA